MRLQAIITNSNTTYHLLDDKLKEKQVEPVKIEKTVKPKTHVTYINNKRVEYSFESEQEVNKVDVPIEEKQVEAPRTLTSEEAYLEFIKQIKDDISYYKMANYLTIVVVGIFMKMSLKSKKKNQLFYQMDEYSAKKYEDFCQLLESLNSSHKLWEIVHPEQLQKKVKNGVSYHKIQRKVVKFSRTKHGFCDFNIPILVLQLAHGEIYFLPDKVVVIDQDNIYPVEYGSLEIFTRERDVLEKGYVSQDVDVHYYTYQYINSSNQPVFRFGPNPKLPVCKYGEVIINTNQDIEILLHCSNVHLLKAFNEKYRKHRTQYREW